MAISSVRIFLNICSISLTDCRALQCPDLHYTCIFFYVCTNSIIDFIYFWKWITKYVPCVIKLNKGFLKNLLHDFLADCHTINCPNLHWKCMCVRYVRTDFMMDLFLSLKIYKLYITLWKSNMSTVVLSSPCFDVHQIEDIIEYVATFPTLIYPLLSAMKRL